MSLTGVPFTDVQIGSKFWRYKLAAIIDVAIPACLDKCEETGRIDNLRKAAGFMAGEFQGTYYDDSDVYKVLEGVAYSLMTKPDPELEARADGIIAAIAGAQEDDGYLMSYYTLTDNPRWSDMEKHEMYCGGHLIEAAIAYKQATGKTKLLEVAKRVADHYDDLFGPGKRHWVPGHQEIELALVKLYEETGEKRYLNLAHWLLEERGRGYGKGAIWDKPEWGPKYCQDDLPVKDMSDVAGHAVRAMYMYCAMADVGHHMEDSGYEPALLRLWDSVVNRNMYITGGIGSTRDNEGFTQDYDLPNDTAYCETCASVGMVLWNHRMNLLSGEAKYADVMERALYNGVLSGVSLEGDRFFYVNPLYSNGDHHREEWYHTSCCPTQISRFIPSIGNYVYALDAKGIWINLYMEGKASLDLPEGVVTLSQKTAYPWDGSIQISIKDCTTSDFSLNLRFPGWCKSAKVLVNGDLANPRVVNGYLQLTRKWVAGDTILLDLDMPVELMRSHPKIKQNQNSVALQRGPVVYCVEELDCVEKFEELSIHWDDRFIVQNQPQLLGGVNTITVLNNQGEVRFTAIPYYAWDNRSPGKMRVWLPKEKDTISLYQY